MIETIDVNTASSPYRIGIGRGLLANKEHWSELVNGQLIVISNDRVAPLYLDALRSALPCQPLIEIIVPDGEQEKNVDNWMAIQNQLAGVPVSRDATLIALGGGVIGDLTGFVAATYMRGIRFVQVPTTLLAQVDASVGGKTAINLTAGKNLVGAFHQPGAVIVDPNTLSTLPPRETAAGWAEVIKVALIRDPELLELFENGSDGLQDTGSQQVQTLITRAIYNKVEVVVADEKEAGERALLNLGHTFGHAIETLTDYRKYLHGEAVAIGLVAAAHLSSRLGLVDPDLVQRIKCILSDLSLPTSMPALPVNDLLDCMGADKKVLEGKLRLVLLNGLGQACIRNDIPTQLLVETLEYCGASND